MKHIVYSIGELSVAGGIGRIVSLKANWFAEHGYKVTIITTEGNTKESYYLLSPKIEIIPLNINYLTVYNNKRNLWGMIKSLADRIKKTKLHKKLLKKYLQDHPCDVFFTTGNIPFVCRFKDGSKKIYETHFSCEAQRQFIKNAPKIFAFFYRMYDALQQRNLRHYDHVVVLTQRDLELRGKPENGVVIPNFITAKTQEILPDYQSKKVISVGRYDHVKGFDLLFKVWKIVKTNYPDWHLHIYGHAYGRTEYYQNLIQESGVQNVVHLHSEVKDIESKYMSSSFYVMASRYEGFPLVLPEAMSCGLPCIAYDINCGPSDIITDGVDGILVHALENVEALAEAICKMIENPQLREDMGKRAKKNIQRFNIDQVMQYWIEMIER